MKTVRPHQIFQLLDREKNHYCKVLLPVLNRGTGGISFLETAILTSLFECIEPSKVFEFGTFLGGAAVMFAMNSRARVTTLDIPKDGIEKNISKDDELREVSKSISGIYIDQSPDKIKKKITRIFCDSRTFDVEKEGFTNQFDFIFIDAGHGYKMVKNDTEKSLQLLKKNGTIVWHDYHSAANPDVTRFVDEYAKSRMDEVFHVADTMLAIQSAKIAKLLV